MNYSTIWWWKVEEFDRTLQAFAKPINAVKLVKMLRFHAENDWMEKLVSNKIVWWLKLNYKRTNWLLFAFICCRTQLNRHLIRFLWTRRKIHVVFFVWRGDDTSLMSISIFDDAFHTQKYYIFIQFLLSYLNDGCNDNCDQTSTVNSNISRTAISIEIHIQFVFAGFRQLV